MKTQTINGVECTVKYHTRVDLVQCVIECVVDGARWSGYGATKPVARQDAVETMLDSLQNG